jgi:hypothetical protein
MYTDKEILRLVTEGKSEATRKKYQAMIGQIVSLSGENTLSARQKKPTATTESFAPL